MPERPVLRHPHPSLKEVARALDLDAADDAAHAREVARDLHDTMEVSPGCVGIAAPQIDALVRLIVVDVRGHRKATTDNGELVLVNPVVVASEGAEVAREGCLSIPDLTANVRRATDIVVEARTLDGDALRIESEGFEARCLLHEIDHLEGLLFLDRVDSLTADVFPRKRRSR
jgi:peptide deformylase